MININTKKFIKLLRISAGCELGCAKEKIPGNTTAKKKPVFRLYLVITDFTTPSLQLIINRFNLRR